MVFVLPRFARDPLIATVAAFAVAGILGCSSDPEVRPATIPEAASRADTTSEGPMKTPEEVQSDFEAAWMALPKVIGVGVGEYQGRPSLVVFVSAAHEAHADIPESAGGYPVRIDVVGDVKAEGEQ